MEKSVHDELETLYYQKLERYEELAEVFTRERKSIEGADLEAMWRCSEEKQKISSQIIKIRQDILILLDQAGIGHRMNGTTFHTPAILSLLPKQQSRTLRKIHVSMIMIKNRVHALLEENKKCITDYLGILDELIGIITNAGKQEPLYDHHRYCHGGKKNNLLLHKEV
ncbi:MAG: flagellar export chaperone FlgN [Pseudomonadota bacterium]